MYVICRVMNALINNGDTKHDKPFSLVINNKEYTLRTIPGDIAHLLNNPRTFVYYRLNPTYMRTLVEALTNRDDFGRYRDLQDQAVDFFTTHIPLPLQRKGERTLFESALSSMGVNVYNVRSRFEKELGDLVTKRRVYTIPKEDRAKFDITLKYVNELRDKIKSHQPITEVTKRINADVKSGRLAPEDVNKIDKRYKTDPIMDRMESLPVEDIMNVWHYASPDERSKYTGLLEKKLVNVRDTAPERFKRLSGRIQKIKEMNKK
jgi:hypothetical protein